MKKRLVDLARRWKGSLLAKLLTQTILGLLIPFMVSNILTYAINYRAILAESVNSNAGLLTVGVSQWKEYVDTLENAPLVFYEGLEARELLRKPAPLEAVEEYNLRELLTRLLKEDASFRQAQITAASGTTISQEKLGQEGGENWRAHTGLEWTDGQQRITVGRNEAGSPAVLVFRKDLIDYPSEEVFGSFQLYSDLSGLSGIAEAMNGSSTSDGVVGLFDCSAGQLLYATGSMGDLVYQEYGTGWIRGHMNGIDGFFFMARCDYKGISLEAIRFVPRSILLKSLHQTMLQMFLIQAVLLALVIAFVLFIYRSMVRPIQDIAANMVKVEEGIYEYTSRMEGTDEIARLDKTYAEMVSRINQLINKDYKSALEISRTRLKLLQAQINPHFLNNMLQNISTRALKEGSRDTYNLLTRLARIFQYNMDTSADYVPLSQEITHITNYLTLQRERFRENLCFDIQCTDAAGQIEVPKMILQPLVENSISHGIRNREGTGVICVEVFSDPDILHIIVSDNGAGMSPEKIQELKHKFDGSYTINTTQGHGIGFLNVLYRLNLYTDGNFTWDIESEPLKETKILLHIGRRENAP